MSQWRVLELPAANVRCQCHTWDRGITPEYNRQTIHLQCPNRMTSEDFLCDPCRKQGHSIALGGVFSDWRDA